SWRSYLFFFSSRRRHTRWPRDWSSDVCSSDLSASAEWNPVAEAEYFASVCGLVASGAGWSIVDPMSARTFQHLGVAIRDFEPARSEERRVGKECRSRWSAEH